MSNRFQDLTGKRFQRLVVIARNIPIIPRKNKHTYWECLCDCGNPVVVKSTHLHSGNTKSCGCYARDNIKERSTTHGLTDSPEYNSWKSMNKRCYSKSNQAYARYGGRGITVCDEWKNSFEAFYRDMGSRPSSEHTLDRKDNSKGYSKENCRWATKKEQANNRRNSIFCEHNGERRTIPEWCLVLGLNYHLIRRRIRAGWSFEKAIAPICSINVAFEGVEKPLHAWCELLDLNYQATYFRIIQGDTLETIASED